tara:strand:+ start:78286 stop:79287 length:1002 start_codon:yes stop_codon:yes gene_type:complete
MSKILLATDAWFPQVNGVVRALDKMREIAEQRGHEFVVVHPENFRSFACPSYPEIRLALATKVTMRSIFRAEKPDYIHIPTEGPIGLIARNTCMQMGIPFTTSYHTKFPDYVNELTRIPKSWAWKYLRWFHKPSRCLMTLSPTMVRELQENGFRCPLKEWGRGVDTDIFRPRLKERPEEILIGYVGRVSKEKNLDKFCQLDLPYRKVIVGDGPYREALESRYPDIEFTGYRKGEALAREYERLSVKVFPSLTDTFGMVNIEALACGTPVAAYPVTGPKDIITDPRLGCLHDDLSVAVETALRTGQRDYCSQFVVENYSWEHSADQFLSGLNRI